MSIARVNTLNRKLLFAATLVAVACTCSAQQATITVAVDQPSHRIPRTLWGVFFEDINLSADGGIYPELVRKRSFEDSEQPEHWQITGATATIDGSKPLNPFNRHALRLQVDGTFGVENEAYWGMNIVQGEDYTFKLAARAQDLSGDLGVRILGADGQELAKGQIAGLSREWKYHDLDLKAVQGDHQVKLEISNRRPQSVNRCPDEGLTQLAQGPVSWPQDPK